MTTRNIAFCVGLFSVIMGFLTYDSEIATAPVPIVTGALVMLLAIFKLIPELKRCPACNRKIPKKSDKCRHCGAEQPEEDN